MVAAVAELVGERSIETVGENSRTLVVDCSELQFLSTEVLSKLIRIQRRLERKTHTTLVLSGLRAEIRGVLHWTRLDRYFEIRTDDNLVAP